MLLDNVKQIVTKSEEQNLFDSKKVNTFFLDLAKDESKPIMRAFIECLEYGVIKILKGVAKEELANCKEALAQRLCAKKGGDAEFYQQAIDILCEMLFGSVLSSTTATVNIPKDSTAILTMNHNRYPQFEDPRDGNIYGIVKIGNQVWMAENLNYKTDGSWGYYDNDANGNVYGRLYTWHAAMNACPEGWHLPTRQEWNELLATVGGPSVAGKMLKARTGWHKRGNGTNDYGFSALPGGYLNSDGYFYGAGDSGYWWTATADGYYFVYRQYMDCNYDHVGENNYYYRYPYDYKKCGFSVRCVKDGAPIR